MEFLNQKQKIILVLIAILMIAFIGYYIIKKSNDGYTEIEIAEQNDIEIEQTEVEEIKEDIIVHIAGEVENEGIITIKEGSRIAEVIDKAGGTTKEADLSNINLAYKVEDGQKIYVPNKNNKEDVEYITKKAGEGIINNEENKAEKVNINTASQTELETLSGIGPSTAIKIIEYREENGKFKKIEDIKNVPGIGDAKFNNIKEEITV